MPPDAMRPLSGVVIGAGPAGLMAADTMARQGFHVTVFERMPSAGRKFLMAGRGGLNLTHSDPIGLFEQRYADAAPWLGRFIRQFPPEELRAWADRHDGESFVGSSGRVFPKSFKASPLLRAWLRELGDLGVVLKTRMHWTGWTNDGSLEFADGSAIDADVCVLALGGASWPRLGAGGNWVSVLAGKGIEITPLVASNAGVTCDWSDVTSSRHAGAPLKRVAATVSGRCVRGEALISKTGLEGGVIYALSRELRRELQTAGSCTVLLDLRPDLDVERLAANLAKVPRKQSLANKLRKGAGLSPQAISVWRDCVQHHQFEPDAALAGSIKAAALRVTGMQPIDRAISTAGGIAAHEVDETLMLRQLPGVFVCGEMLDWDAPTGGYLLQACFSTGRAAGENAARFARELAGH